MLPMPLAPYCTKPVGVEAHDVDVGLHGARLCDEPLDRALGEELLAAEHQHDGGQRGLVPGDARGAGATRSGGRSALGGGHAHSLPDRTDTPRAAGAGSAGAPPQGQQQRAGRSDDEHHEPRRAG
jgi:hypothetical protein